MATTTINAPANANNYAVAFNADTQQVWNTVSLAWETPGSGDDADYGFAPVATLLNGTIQCFQWPATGPCNGILYVYTKTGSGYAPGYADGAAQWQESGFWTGSLWYRDGSYMALLGQTITINANTLVNGGTITIQQGDDYATADGTAWTATINNYTGPSLSGATGVMNLIPEKMYQRGQNIVLNPAAFTATITQSGSTVTITVPMTAAQTNLLYGSPPMDAENYAWSVVATLATSGHIKTLIQGLATVNAAISPQCG